MKLMNNDTSPNNQKNLRAVKYNVSEKERSQQKHQRACVLWLTGMSGAGKSSLAVEIDEYLSKHDFHSFVLDGDNLRKGINKDLGFTDEARHENIRRTAEIAKLFYEAGLIIIVSLISPFQADRTAARKAIGADNFHEIYIKASLSTCEKRDPKGFYKMAHAGKIPNFTGIESIYEEPKKPDLVIDTNEESVEQSTERLIDYLESHGLLAHVG